MIDRLKRLHLPRAQAVLFTLAFGLMAQFLCVADSYGQTQRPRKVSVQLKWKHQFQFAGIYAAKAKGFYRDAGLGLPISLGLARLLGGGITIESRPGKGSVFKVEILTKPA